MTQDDKKTALWTAGATVALILLVAGLWFAGVIQTPAN